MTDRPTISERYSRAADASDLTLRLSSSSAADVIMAAGLASQGVDLEPHARNLRNMALALWRMKEGDMSQFAVACGVLATWLRGKAERERFKDGGRWCYERVVSRSVYWWANPVCRCCDGRKHPTIPNSPVLDETRVCEECKGTGVTPLERMVQPEYIYAAKVLVNEMDRITSEVFGAMRRKLRSGGE